VFLTQADVKIAEWCVNAALNRTAPEIKSPVERCGLLYTLSG
jgi:hypothetical protein